MNLFFKILTDIAILAIAATTVFYFVNIFLWPENAAQEEYESYYYTIVSENRFYSACAMAAFVGIWFCTYKGIITVLNWISSNWIDEDLIFTIAFLVSFFGALGLLSGISSLLSRLHKDRIEIYRLRGDLKVLGTGAAQFSAEQEPEVKHPPATPREAAILKEYGYSENDIASMPPEQRATEIKDALDAGYEDPGGNRQKPLDL
jgi:uncharacterized membrane protein HdeD (DUF308 family)